MDPHSTVGYVQRPIFWHLIPSSYDSIIFLSLKILWCTNFMQKTREALEQFQRKTGNY